MAMPPIAANPETEGKGANGKERSSAKKLKGSSAAAKAGESGKVASGSGNDGASLSADSGTEGSSDGSDGNQQDYGGNKKGSFEQMLADASALGNSSVPGKPVVPTNLNIGMELWNPSNAAAKMRPNTSGMAPPGDERELKRQKRKQSNRESARRSRLRKQAECEELQGRVENLISDNDTLKEELRKISEEYEKLTAANNSMKEELVRICGPEAVANLDKCDPTNEGVTLHQSEDNICSQSRIS
jgi:plant G-box-binding factor